MHIILDRTIAEAEANHRQIYNQHANMMRFLAGMGMPVPDPLNASARVALNAGLREAVSAENLDASVIRRLLDEGNGIGLQLDEEGIRFALQKRVDAIASDFRGKPGDLELLRRFEEAVDVGRDLPFPVPFFGAQNVYDDLRGTAYPGFLERSRTGDEEAAKWVGSFRSLGEKLHFLLPED
jgi:hypothetical protein